MLNKTGVCVYVSQSKRENHPVPQEGGWEIEWPYIFVAVAVVVVEEAVVVVVVVVVAVAVVVVVVVHGVCVYGKRETILFHKGGVGR